MASAHPPLASASFKRGVLAAMAAYGTWGVLPLYFAVLGRLSPVEIVAQRILWAGAILLGLLLWRGRLAATLGLVRSPRILLALMLSGAFIFANWLIYVIAVHNKQLLAGSLGYFLNPLMNVALGVAFFRERLRPAQKVAIGLACAGVAVMASVDFSQIGISLALGGSFAIYGLIRKLTPVDALDGLTIETWLLMPVGAAMLLHLGAAGRAGFDGPVWESALVAGLGAVTILPLVLFAVAARALPLSVMGAIQYLAPSIQFFCATLVLGEPLNATKLASFAIIWAALAIFTFDMVRHARRARQAPPPA